MVNYWGSKIVTFVTKRGFEPLTREGINYQYISSIIIYYLIKKKSGRIGACLVNYGFSSMNFNRAFINTIFAP